MYQHDWKLTVLEDHTLIRYCLLCAETEELCIHYWVIATANGSVSTGVCQKCGEVKEFKNTVKEKYV